MSFPSDVSDDVSEKQDDKDEDFNISDCCDDIDSDDSYCDDPETNNSTTSAGYLRRHELPGTSNGILESNTAPNHPNKPDDNIQENNQDEEEPQQENEFVGPVLPGGHRFDRKFICIKYPGNVINPDKALDTLGGIGSISTAINTPNRRLELRFRPDDAFCKPACGDRHHTTGFLLRVRVKKSRVKKVEEAEAKKKASNATEADSGIKDNAETENDLKNKSQDECAITDLVSQIQSCSVGPNDSECPSNRHLSCESTKSIADLSIETEQNTVKNKKNPMPTFDRNKYEDLSEDSEYRLPKLKVLGRVSTEFRFTNLCDFQYLPLTQTKTNPDKLECVYDMIYPSGIPPYSWMKKDVPYFLPPAAFSRMDTVQHYIPKTEVDSQPENIIGKNRRRKAGFTNFIAFTATEVPKRPPAGIETAMIVKFVQNTHLEQMRQIFEERPIWSKNAICYKTGFSNDRLKVLLPSVAYYFVSGPWKIMWVKLGYDPRKDMSARKYQTLDYRLKAMHGLGSTVKCKRNYSEYTLPYKSAPISKQKTTILSADMSQEQSHKKDNDLNENVYIYREGMVPPSRQMFYQYCDVLVDEIQEMLAKLPDPLPGVRCHEKRGWLPSGFDVQCREIINKQVRAVLRKQMNIPEDHPTSLPRKRKHGIRLKLNPLRRKKPKKSESVASGAEESEEKCEEVEPNSSTKEN